MQKIAIYIFLFFVSAQAFAQNEQTSVPTEQALQVEFAEKITPVVIEIENDTSDIGEINIQYSVERALDNDKKIIVVNNLTILILGYDADKDYPLGAKDLMVVKLLTSSDRKFVVKNYGEECWNMIKKQKGKVFFYLGKDYYRLNPQGVIILAGKKKKKP